MDVKVEKVYRDTYWSEIDDKEKCKRLRERVKRLEHKIGLLERMVYALISHSHDAAGVAVAEIVPSLPSESGGASRTSDDVYF